MTAPIAPQQDANRARISRNVDKMLAQGASEAEVEEYIRSEGLAPREDFSDVQAGDSSTADVGLVEGLARSAAQGASFGFSDELQGITATGAGPLGLLTPGGRERYRAARDIDRARVGAFQDENPGKALLAEVLGSIPTAAVGGAARAGTKLPALAQALRAAKTASVAGGVAGAGFSEADSPLGVAGDAALGAGLGGAVGFGGSMLARGGRALKDLVHDARDPRGAVIRQAAKLLPDDAEQIVARQNLEAPGTAVVGDLTRPMQQMAGQMAKSDRVAATAPLAMRGRAQDIGIALEGMGPEYDALQRQLPIDQPLLDALAQIHKSVPGAVGDETDFLTLQRLRSDARKAHRSMIPSMARHELGEGIQNLSQWLQTAIPEIQPIDERYSFVTGRKHAADLAANLVERRAGSSSAVAAGGGNTRGHPGGWWGMFTDLFRPDKGMRAEQIQETLFNPQATQNVLPEVRAARTVLLAPGQPNTLGSGTSAAAGAGIGRTAAALSNFMADEDEREIQMRTQQQQLMGGMP